MNFAEPLKIDEHLTLATRAIASPMAGVMSGVFCRAASQMRLIRNWLTPFICVSPGSVPSLTSLRKKILPFQNGMPLIVQLLGHDANAMAETARRLGEIGVVGVNLNFACPAPLVRKNGNGGMILGDPGKLHAMTSAAVKAAGNLTNVSVKIRTGVHSPSETAEIACALNDAGIRFVICHFRTVDEMYDPVPDPMKRLANVRESLDPQTILIGNGDISGLADAEKMVLQTGCDGVAVGRALLRDPFVLQKICIGEYDPAGPEERMAF